LVFVKLLVRQPPGLPDLFLRPWYVCDLSVICRLSVCHIRALCLNCSTDLDAIRQVPCRVLWHIVLQEVRLPDEGEIWGSNPQP